VAGVTLDCDDANSCTADGCDAVLGCLNSSLGDGTSCNDGQFCNVGETCSSGVCIGGAPRDCSSGTSDCTIGVCNENADSCDAAPTNEGGSCEDGDFCSTADLCSAGSCIGGPAPNCNDSEPCTSDSCNPSTGCVNSPIADGSSCSDGTVCTTADLCTGGVCGGAGMDCDDANECTADSCDAFLGCQNVPVVNGTDCDDGDLCNGTETCQSGLCGAGSVPDCDDANPCTADSCDAVLGCQNAPVLDGTSCDDGDVCNGAEACQAGSCSPGTTVDCDDGNVCTADSCDAVLGCQIAAVPDGVACNDGNVCNGAETCQVGTCGSGTALDCDDGNPCTADSCDALLGCQNTAVVDGTSCDDGLSCNGADTCQVGTCVSSGLNCDDGNACTADSCDDVLGCVNTPIANGTSCADGDLCNGGETCQAGACAAGAPPDCDDANLCTADICDAVLGCLNIVVPDGVACNDGDVCNGGETCQSGLCLAGPTLDCDDDNVCTADSCDAVLGCQNVPVGDGTSCDDGDLCNGSDSCQAGACVTGTPLDCDDSNVCTADSCDAVLGCRNLSLGDGTSCDDGDVCNGTDVCQTGVCVGGTPLDCDDGNVCSADACDAVLGCRNIELPNVVACNDADLCNGGETCQSGLCLPGPALDCDDGNICTADSCDAVLGCQNAPVADGTSCDDGDVCNGTNQCQTGACISGTPLDCDDANPCTADSCDAILGCRNLPVANGTACDDGTVCNGVDTCQAGICSVGTAPDCDDGNLCTADSCDAVQGCRNIAVPDGVVCGDGDVCNGGETCQSGLCLPGPPLGCDDGNECTADSCDGVLGCQNVPVSDGISCADGSVCNGAETCQVGTCTAGTPLACDDANVCTAESCDAVLGCQSLPVPNGISCDDGDVCNGAENCQAGACAAGTPLACDDGSVCTTDSCDAVLGCQSTPVDNGTSCDDGLSCNGTETCQAGACVSSGLNCDDGNVCTADTCDDVLGCVNTPVGDGTACADGNLCNGDETCQAGLCLGSLPPDCDDGNVCTADTCDAIQGCRNIVVPDGVVCSDGDVCNGAETCQSGLCLVGPPPDCDDGNVCTADSCDAVLGCQNTPLADGASCDDGDVCNGTSTCQTGACNPGTPLNCEDGNACTADSCDAVLGCRNLAIADGTTCDDGDRCNGTDLCQAGVCAAGTPPDCDDGNLCTVDACDALLGCRNVDLQDGVGCNDAALCNGGEICKSGLCVPGPSLDCDDGNVCTADSCDAVLGCQNVAVVDGTSCDDGDLCNGTSTCQVGTCTSGTPPDCDDGNVCTADSCDAVLGCRNLPIADGISCDDGDVCNGLDTCQAGACSAGTAPDCDDGNLCTADSCDAVLGCRNIDVPDEVACVDGDLCNGAERCQSGVCVPGPAPDCDDGNVCTADSCDALLGCQSVPVSDGIACGDGDVCNGGETCQAGACTIGAPLDCDDANVCTADSCDAVLGCRNLAVPNGISCGDGDVCNGGETCQTGSCTVGTPLACDDANVCTADSCDAVLGTAQRPARPVAASRAV